MSIASLEVPATTAEVNILADSRLDPNPSDSNSLATLGRSFAQILTQTKAFPNMDIPIKPQASAGASDPTVFFSEQEIEISCRSFLYSIIVKCSYGRPSIPEVKQIIYSRFQLKSDFVISMLDVHHLLIRFNNEVGFLLVWLKESMYVKAIFFDSLNGPCCLKREYKPQ